MPTDSDAPHAEAPHVWKDIRIVLIAGGLGGLASWLYGIVMDDPVPAGMWGVLVSIVLGAFASGVGVFVLTNTDTRAFARTIFFAALCGFAWKPVCDAGKAFIDQTVQERQDAAAKDISDKLDTAVDELRNASGTELEERLEEVRSLAEATVHRLPAVNNSMVRSDVESSVNRALSQVERAAPDSPETASRVLEEVGDTASMLKQSAITTRSLSALQKLENSTSNRSDLQVYTATRARLSTNITERFLRTAPFQQSPRVTRQP